MQWKFSPIDLLIVQPTTFCNINCSYCYLPHRSSKQQMSDDTIELLFKDLFTSGLVQNDLTVVWHAGEPLVPGIAFYNRAFALINRLNSSGFRITHNIQTNGIMITPQWINLFRQHDVQLGLSIDGPQWLHDANRKMRNDTGTFKRVMEAVRLLRNYEFPFHVITVLTRNSLTAADELVDFYIEHGITDVGFNLEEREGQNARSSLEGVDISQIRQFFRTILARVKREPDKLRVRELLSARDVIIHRELSDFGNPEVTPLRIVSVGVNGELTTFSPELLGTTCPKYGNFVFGNVHETGLMSILDSSAMRRAYEDIQDGVEMCRTQCGYFQVCLGGQPANKLFELGTLASTETVHCRFSKQAIIDVVLEDLEQVLGIYG